MSENEMIKQQVNQGLCISPVLQPQSASLTGQYAACAPSLLAENQYAALSTRLKIKQRYSLVA